MSSDNTETTKLPHGWVLCMSKSTPGRKYYFNKKTGKSSWSEPQAGKSNERQRSKKLKNNPRDKKNREEAQKKSVKRKSDGHGDHSVSKSKNFKDNETQKSKQPRNDSSKTESPTKLTDTNKRHSTNKQIVQTKEIDKKENDKELKDDSTNRDLGRDNMISLESPAKGTPPKNIANARLSQLRAQLSSEVQIEENKDKSPVKSKRKSPVETDTKVSKMDKSPTLNESKCATQSPSNDSLHSIPSPSQFFAANKIISSMMAQLPEEYNDKVKPKNTFAEIEQGIYSQVNEYPNLKHPVTPPQFSEASKLVSAIKSRLSSKEGDLRTFNNARDRMEALRNRLSVEAAEANEDSIMSDDGAGSQAEAMDVDSKEAKESEASCTKDIVENSEHVVLVVDTNIFIHELDFIKNVLNSHIKGYAEQPILLVPWRVVNELDRLKDNNNGNGAVCKRARSAMDYLYKSLPHDDRIKGQSLRDSNSHIYPCEMPDDEILNCCLQQAERGKSTILLSNDKNLCNKACINKVKCISLAELAALLESKPRPGAHPDLLHLRRCQAAAYTLLSNILENEMRAKYNNLWQHVLFKAPPWTLADVLQCLLKHWVAVFSDVFPRIEHLITDLNASLKAINNKDPKSLSESEVANFKELCLEVAKKCQIIPEYMELAKATVEQLTKKSEEEDPDILIVIEMFECVWKIFSSYCAKLSTHLGIPHSLEDSVPGEESLQVLTSKFTLFYKHISELANAVEAMMFCDPSGMDTALLTLVSCLRDSLAALGMHHDAINTNNIALFCTHRRSMLQEAHTKFSQLMEILNACKINLGCM